MIHESDASATLLEGPLSEGDYTVQRADRRWGGYMARGAGPTWTAVGTTGLPHPEDLDALHALAVVSQINAR